MVLRRIIMIICEKCKNLCNCKEGPIFIELKNVINHSIEECECYEEEKPEFKIIKGGKK